MNNHADSTEPPAPVAQIASTDFAGSATRTRTAKYGHLAKLVISTDDIAGYRLHPTVHDHIAKKLEGRGPALAQGPRSVRIYFGIDGEDIAIAQKEAMDLVDEVIGDLGLRGAQILSLEIAVPRAETTPVAPTLVGLREVATLLGVSHQRAGQLAQRADFPTPIQRLRATPVWIESDVRRFANDR